MLTLYSVGTLIILAFAVWLLWRTIGTHKGWIGPCITFFILAIPLLYTLYNHAEVVDADIGLGLSFFFTWAVTILLMLIGGFRFYSQKRNVH